jgi:hypothetical protein
VLLGKWAKGRPKVARQHHSTRYRGLSQKGTRYSRVRTVGHTAQSKRA